jgi:hypothetical protein
MLALINVQRNLRKAALHEQRLSSTRTLRKPRQCWIERSRSRLPRLRFGLVFHIHFLARAS